MHRKLIHGEQRRADALLDLGELHVQASHAQIRSCAASFRPRLAGGALLTEATLGTAMIARPGSQRATGEGADFSVSPLRERPRWPRVERGDVRAARLV